MRTYMRQLGLKKNFVFIYLFVYLSISTSFTLGKTTKKYKTKNIKPLK